MFISQDPLGDAQRYVGGNPVSFVDPLGLAYFAKQNLRLSFPIPGMNANVILTGRYIPMISYGNSFLDKENIEFSHEHIFFEDGLIPGNVGYGPDGLFYNQNPNEYMTRSIKYDDAVLRQAFQNVSKTGNFNKSNVSGQKTYNGISHNCQDFTGAVRAEYQRLIKAK